jgi:hypothetical protein
VKSGAEFLCAKDPGTLENIRNTRTIQAVYIAGKPVQ